MNKKSTDKIVFDDYLGCFGDFDLRDPICKKLCALKLRCAVECYQNDQLEFWEDVTFSDDGIKFVF
ncbi:hypothetical protein QUF72_13655 [Desulfobacterales bacterium HSG2]|nr:hypothetical protein [Desulfobacterales bacterium HSG2]